MSEANCMRPRRRHCSCSTEPSCSLLVALSSGFGAPYMMLHSLAHLLITQVSLECGYSSSAIRERVYAGEAGYGILLYTGSPDSEGTLGGLVEIGRKIDQHLRNAIELGRLCSNDPVCAQHSAKQPLEERFLLGAACHGCLLISETSCERSTNIWIGRWLLPRSAQPVRSSS